MSEPKKPTEKTGEGSAKHGTEHRQCPMTGRREATCIRETVTSTAASSEREVGRSCPININGPEFHKALKSKLDASGISLCPMMGKSLSAESKDFSVVVSSTPTDSMRPDTPEEEKLDLRHLSVALMKLLYPKASDVYDVIKKNVTGRNNGVWDNAAKLFRMKYSIEQLANDDKEDFTGSEHEILERSLSIGSTQQSNGSVKTGSQPGDQIDQSPASNIANENKSDSSFMVDHDPLSFDQLEQFAKHLAKKLSTKQELNWEELIVECGEQYAQQCHECDSKPLHFVGDNLVDFLVNVENIQSIAYEEISSLEGANKFWTPSQQDLLPITIFVNHSESQIVITYNIQQPICRFVACFLSGLYRKLARILFNIIIKVRVEIGSDQYKFILENRVVGASLVQIEGHVSRYKQSLLMKQHQQLPLSVQTFARVFPFHFMCDQNLRFIQYGNGLRKVFGEQNKIQAHISNVFSIVQPNVGFFFESIRHRTNLAFILRIRDNILNENFRGLELKGQIIECVESKSLLFFGSPIIKGLQSLTGRGLFLSDIPIHDATRDIILVEEQSRAQESLKRRMDKLKESIVKANNAVEIERRKNVDLLGLIFPANVARQLWNGQLVEARQYNDVTMLFSDIVGFTSICSSASPMAIINMLKELYSQFDAFCGEVDVYKTETIGDAYCVASGIHRLTEYHAVLAAFMALKMIDAVCSFLPKDINVDKFQVTAAAVHSLTADNEKLICLSPCIRCVSGFTVDLA